MVHKCQIMISPAFCFVLSKFWFFWLLGGSKGKKWPKKTKNSVCSTLYLRNYTSYDLHLWCTFVKGLYIHTFFCIFPNLIFRVFSGLKEQKMAQNDKELSVSRAWQIWYLQALIFVCIKFGSGTQCMFVHAKLHVYKTVTIRVGQLAYIMYVCLLLLLYTWFWTGVLWHIRSFFYLWFFKVVRFFLFLIILYCLKTYYYIFDL